MLRKLPLIVCILALCLSSCLGISPAAGISTVKHPKLQSLPSSFPKIDRHPAAANYMRGLMTTLPTYNPDSSEQWQMDLRSFDLSGLDLRDSLKDLLYADFDSQTKWPPSSKMPAGYEIEKIMSSGKNPGLDIRALRERGITGWGVGIAIIDQPMLVDHQEYSSQLRLYEEINIAPGAESQMHGLAVASIAVGKNVGVAPDADLYYIGSWTGDWGVGENGFTYNFVYYAQGVRRILEINKQLPADRRIRVIAMQVGWSPEQKGYDDIMAAVEQAKAAGIFVVSSSLELTFGLKFHGLGRDPLTNPDQFTSYEPGLWWADKYFAGPQFSDRLLVPMDSRTTASPTGVNDYVFYREGGWSWSIPYIAGMYALACQVDPTISPERFWELAMQTGRTLTIDHAGKTYSMGPILDPVALVKVLQK